MMSACRVSGVPAGPGGFTVPSVSVAGASHAVEFAHAGLGGVWCDCFAFGRRQDCEHVRQVAALVKSESRARVSTPEDKARAAATLKEIKEIYSR